MEPPTYVTSPFNTLSHSYQVTFPTITSITSRHKAQEKLQYYTKEYWTQLRGDKLLAQLEWDVYYKHRAAGQGPLAQYPMEADWVPVRVILMCRGLHKLAGGTTASYDALKQQIVAAVRKSTTLELDESEENVKGAIVPELRKVWLDPDDRAAMIHALAAHPDAEEKIGVGATDVFVARGPKGHCCFHVFRVDGSSDSFSYQSLFSTPRQRARRHARQAFYDATVSQRHAFVDAQRVQQEQGHRLICGISGRPIDLNRDRYDIDHHPTSFASIINDFLTQRGLELRQIQLTPEGQLPSDLLDQFQEVHQTVSLRLVLRAEHERRNAALGNQ